MADMDYLVAFGQKGLDDIATGKKMIEESIAKIKELNTELATIGLKRLNSDDLKGAIKSYEDLKKKQEDFNKTVVQSIDLSKKMAKAKSDELKQIDTDYKTLNKSIQDNANEYRKLSQEHARLRDEAKSLGVIYGTTSKEFLNATQKANDLDKKLKEIDAALGQHQRSVGNYKAAFDGFGLSVQQIAREVPNFALSFTTGISAISNNLPILADEIKRARDENKALIESGSVGIPVWKRFVSSLFSWQTALVLGITVLLNYSKQIKEFISGTKDAAESQKELEEAVNKTTSVIDKQFEKQEKRISKTQASLGIDTQTAKRKLDLLKASGASEREILDAEIDYLDKKTNDLTVKKEKYEYLLSEVNRVGIGFKEREEYKGQYNEQFISFVSKTLQERLFLTKEESDAEAKTIVESFNTKNYALSKYRDTVYEINQDILDSENEKNIAIASFTKKSLEDKKKADEDYKKLLEKQLKEADDANREFTDNVLKNLNDIELGQKESADKEIAILDDKLNRGLITIRTYEKEKALIIKNSEEQISKSQIEYLMSSLRNYGLTAENEAKLREKLTELQIQYTEKSRKADEESTKQKAQNFEGFVARTKGWLDDLNKGFDKQREKDLRKDKDYQQRKLDLQKQFVQDSLNLIFTLLAAENQAKIDSLQKEGNLIEANGQKEIDRINRSLLTAEEKEKKIRAQEARTAMQRQEIDRQIREERRKMAIADRAAALAQIVFNTAVAVTDPRNSFLIPLILAIAAVQTATVLATPLPQYAKGRQGGKAEFAIVGEKGHELVQERDGSMWVTGNKAHLAYLNEGAKVVPNHEFVKQANYYAMKDASRYKPTQSDNMIKDFLKLNLQEQRKINKGLSNLKNKTYINIDGSSNNYIVRKLNRK